MQMDKNEYFLRCKKNKLFDCTKVEEKVANESIQLLIITSGANYNLLRSVDTVEDEIRDVFMSSRAPEGERTQVMISTQ